MPGPEELRAEYAAYRRRQAGALARLLPKEAVRPLYRRARKERGAPPAGTDPLETLVGYCERLLPLPPFELWREDRLAHPDAHLRDVDDSPDAPTAEAPARLAVRAFGFRGETWIATLRAFREGATWKAFVSFEQSGTNVVHRTALIFHGAHPFDVRERFFEFDQASLGAFLRSALP